MTIIPQEKTPAPPDWAAQLKALVDHHTLRVVVTGSSALRIEAGRDSLAGRITTIELGTLRLREIAALRQNEQIPQSYSAPRAGAHRINAGREWMGRC
ncbi:MAG: AAA family ATPase [Roseiflexus sp.]|uniref:AAA family ATPase n=1 Tax=Roseiflexus sp. TaxID=2562120 RepID=UPI0025F85271|nr:AAA family ATPase [Roseiflexus sp.]MCL6542816.1 AAA family ATPase [Roseiflexus sp.]